MSYVGGDPINWVDPSGLQLAPGEKELWDRLPGVVDYWVHERPCNNKQEEMRNKEVRNANNPVNKTPLKRILPQPFTPVPLIPPGQCKGEKC